MPDAFGPAMRFARAVAPAPRVLNLRPPHEVRQAVEEREEEGLFSKGLGFLGRLGEWIGAPGYALRSIMAAPAGDVGKRLGDAVENVADFFTGALTLYPLTGVNPFRLATEREERPELSELLEAYKVPAPKPGTWGRLGVDVLGALFVDPLAVAGPFKMVMPVSKAAKATEAAAKAGTLTAPHLLTGVAEAISATKAGRAALKAVPGTEEAAKLIRTAPPIIPGTPFVRPVTEEGGKLATLAGAEKPIMEQFLKATPEELSKLVPQGKKAPVGWTYQMEAARQILAQGGANRTVAEMLEDLAKAGHIPTGGLRIPFTQKVFAKGTYLGPGIAMPKWFFGEPMRKGWPALNAGSLGWALFAKTYPQAAAKLAVMGEKAFRPIRLTFSKYAKAHPILAAITRLANRSQAEEMRQVYDQAEHIFAGVKPDDLKALYTEMLWQKPKEEALQSLLAKHPEIAKDPARAQKVTQILTDWDDSVKVMAEQKRARGYTIEETAGVYAPWQLSEGLSLGIQALRQQGGADYVQTYQKLQNVFNRAREHKTIGEFIATAKGIAKGLDVDVSDLDDLVNLDAPKLFIRIWRSHIRDMATKDAIEQAVQWQYVYPKGVKAQDIENAMRQSIEKGKGTLKIPWTQTVEHPSIAPSGVARFEAGLETGAEEAAQAKGRMWGALAQGQQAAPEAILPGLGALRMQAPGLGEIAGGRVPSSYIWRPTAAKPQTGTDIAAAITEMEGHLATRQRMAQVAPPGAALIHRGVAGEIKRILPQLRMQKANPASVGPIAIGEKRWAAFYETPETTFHVTIREFPETANEAEIVAVQAFGAKALSDPAAFRVEFGGVAEQVAGDINRLGYRWVRWAPVTSPAERIGAREMALSVRQHLATLNETPLVRLPAELQAELSVLHARGTLTDDELETAVHVLSTFHPELLNRLRVGVMEGAEAGPKMGLYGAKISDLGRIVDDIVSLRRGVLSKSPEVLAHEMSHRGYYLLMAEAERGVVASLAPKGEDAAEWFARTFTDWWLHARVPQDPRLFGIFRRIYQKIVQWFQAFRQGLAMEGKKIPPDVEEFFVRLAPDKRAALPAVEPQVWRGAQPPRLMKQVTHAAEEVPGWAALPAVRREAERAGETLFGVPPTMAALLKGAVGRKGVEAAASAQDRIATAIEAMRPILSKEMGREIIPAGLVYRMPAEAQQAIAGIRDIRGQVDKLAGDVETAARELGWGDIEQSAAQLRRYATAKTMGTGGRERLLYAGKRFQGSLLTTAHQIMRGLESRLELGERGLEFNRLLGEHVEQLVGKAGRRGAVGAQKLGRARAKLTTEEAFASVSKQLGDAMQDVEARSADFDPAKFTAALKQLTGKTAPAGVRDLAKQAMDEFEAGVGRISDETSQALYDEVLGASETGQFARHFGPIGELEVAGGGTKAAAEIGTGQHVQDWSFQSPDTKPLIDEITDALRLQGEGEDAIARLEALRQDAGKLAQLEGHEFREGLAELDARIAREMNEIAKRRVLKAGAEEVARRPTAATLRLPHKPLPPATAPIPRSEIERIVAGERPTTRMAEPVSGKGLAALVPQAHRMSDEDIYRAVQAARRAPSAQPTEKMLRPLVEAAGPPGKPPSRPAMPERLPPDAPGPPPGGTGGPRMTEAEVKEAVLELMRPLPARRGLQWLIHQANRIYKPWLMGGVLIPRFAFNGRNMLGAIWEGLFDPKIGPWVPLRENLNLLTRPLARKLFGVKTYSETENLIRATFGEMPAEALPKVGEYEGAEFVRLARENGIVGADVGQVELAIDEAAETLAGINAKKGLFYHLQGGGLPRTFTRHVENVHRMGAFAELLRNGVEPAEAARRVGRAFVDYDYQSITDRMLRDFFPGARFTVGTIPVAIEEMLHRPGTVLPLLKAQSAPPGEETPSAPEWLRGGFTVPMGADAAGQSMYLAGLGVPIEELSRLGSGQGIAGGLRQTLSGLHPLMRLPLEVASDTTLYTGRPAGEFRYFPGAMPFEAERMLMASPASRFLAEFRAGWKSLTGDKPQWTALLRSLTGIRTVTVDEDRELKRTLENYFRDEAKEGRVYAFTNFAARGEVDPRLQELLDEWKRRRAPRRQST